MIAERRKPMARKTPISAVRSRTLAEAAPAPAARKRGALPAVHGRRRCVAIAASTGGPPALQQVLAALDADFPASVVIAQHMPEGFTRMFAERLDRMVSVQVRESRGDEELVPGLVLLAPGGKNLAVQRGMAGKVFARIEDPLPIHRYVPSANRLIESAAEAWGKQLVAVVLTGMGDDGASGIRAARAAGAATIAEAEETCVVFGMPREAIRTGAVQQVLPLSKIGAAITAEVAPGEAPAARAAHCPPSGKGVD
jgi:two-component system chemotaxis response regulator CheB